jgi:hypothetical protein
VLVLERIYLLDMAHDMELEFKNALWGVYIKLWNELPYFVFVLLIDFFFVSAAVLK